MSPSVEAYIESRRLELEHLAARVAAYLLAHPGPFTAAQILRRMDVQESPRAVASFLARRADIARASDWRFNSRNETKWHHVAYAEADALAPLPVGPVPRRRGRPPLIARSGHEGRE